MSQPIKQEHIDDGNEDIRSTEDSEWTMASIDTIGDGNSQRNGSNSTIALLEVP
jgi:hypothetical protein